MILSMIFLINILKNVNYPLNISNTGWIEHRACIYLRVQTHRYIHTIWKIISCMNNTLHIETTLTGFIVPNTHKHISYSPSLGLVGGV